MTSDGRDSIASRLYLYGPKRFEPESLALFAEILKLESVNVVLDIGANTGVYSLLAGASGRANQIHSFEPMPDIYARLNENIVTNSFENVIAHNVALSEQSGEINFYFIPAITIPTGGSAAKENWPGVKKVRVKSVSLDTFFQQTNVDSIDLIKIDTEMTEPSILRGGRNVIAEYKPTIICEVLDANSANEITALMQPLGYRFFHIRESDLSERGEIEHDPSYQYANYLFVHDDRIDQMKKIIKKSKM